MTDMLPWDHSCHPPVKVRSSLKKKVLSYSAFVKRVKDTISYHDMLQRGDRVLVAVSGGPDSVCLLKALCALRKPLGIELVVATLDHCIRGKESVKDADFVKDLSKKLGLVCVRKKIDVVKLNKNSKRSLEETAREARYGFLKEAAKKHKCGVIATGHTMDDQSETVLLRIMTGASLKGIAGIPPVRHEGSIRFIRPLIGVEKREVIDHLRDTGLRYREDRTNNETKHLRNKVRLEILPFLEKYNPKIRRALVNLSDTVREDLAFLELERGRAVKGCLDGKEAAKTAAIKLKDIILQPQALKKEIFKELFKRAGGDVKKLTHRHWKDMDRSFRAGKHDVFLDLPGHIRVKKTEDQIEFIKR